MKRVFSIALTLFLLIAATACAGGPPKYNDGTYKARAEKATGGWVGTIEIVVSGNKITSVNWDGQKDDGTTTKKAADAAGQYIMSEDRTKKTWTEQAKVAEEYLIEKQTTKGVTFNTDNQADVLSGVTVDTHEFFVLAEKALKDAK